MAAEFVLVRIDDRLIHGQVAVGWVKACLPTMLVVANDAVAKDPLQTSLMEMAATPAFSVSIGSVQDIVDRFLKKEFEKKRVLLLFSSPQDVWRAVRAGLPIQKLNVGGMRYSPGKRQIMKAIAIDDEDVKQFRHLIDHGVQVTIQMVPTDEIVDMKKYLQST